MRIDPRMSGLGPAWLIPAKFSMEWHHTLIPARRKFFEAPWREFGIRNGPGWRVESSNPVERKRYLHCSHRLSKLAEITHRHRRSLDQATPGRTRTGSSMVFCAARAIATPRFPSQPSQNRGWCYIPNSRLWPLNGRTEKCDLDTREAERQHRLGEGAAAGSASAANLSAVKSTVLGQQPGSAETIRTYRTLQVSPEARAGSSHSTRRARAYPRAEVERGLPGKRGASLDPGGIADQMRLMPKIARRAILRDTAAYSKISTTTSTIHRPRDFRQESTHHYLGRYFSIVNRS